MESSMRMDLWAVDLTGTTKSVTRFNYVCNQGVALLRNLISDKK